MKYLAPRLVFLLAAVSPIPAAAEPSRPPNPFYAMDTAFNRPGLTRDQQFALVKDLGYDGIAWTEQAPDQVKAALADAERHGLKMVAIYYAARVTPDGDLTYSPQLPAVMELLKGHGTLVWLHVGGKGPAFDSLTADSPVVKKLRDLADLAAKNDLRVAVYPHVGEWTARFGDATKLAKLVDHKAFGVTFNLCHCLAMGDGDKIPDLLDAAAPVLFTATISGADAGVKGADWAKLIQPLGQGTFDVGGVLRKLKQVGFTGPIGFQGYGIKADAKAILEPTIQAWRKLSAM